GQRSLAAFARERSLGEQATEVHAVVVQCERVGDINGIGGVRNRFSISLPLIKQRKRRTRVGNHRERGRFSDGNGNILRLLSDMNGNGGVVMAEDRINWQRRTVNGQFIHLTIEKAVQETVKAEPGANVG